MSGAARSVLGVLGLAAAFGPGCSTAGSTWMAEPLTPNDTSAVGQDYTPEPDAAPVRHGVRSRTLGSGTPSEEAQGAPPNAPVAGGRSLGTFRNTYYDFPSEADYDGPTVALPNKSCGKIADVPQSFFEAICVQGSGTLRRGATGKPITPLLTVAVDPAVIPLGTAIYVPELDGMPRDSTGASAHDGCFIAQDRGHAVSGQHIDVFTGHPSITTLWNRRVPSNAGVTVVLDSPRCARVAP